MLLSAAYGRSSSIAWQNWVASHYPLPIKYIYYVAGYPKALAKDLVNSCVEHGLRFNPTVCLEEKVID